MDTKEQLPLEPWPSAGAASLAGHRYRRRHLVNKLMTGLAGLAVGLAVTPLVLVLGYVVANGVSRFDRALLTQLPPPPGFEGGGIANAILGTLMVAAIATLLSVPLGVLCAVWLAEFSQGAIALSRWVRLGVNGLAGLPSIIAGVFIYGLMVRTGQPGYSALAGGAALAVLMLPTVVATADEALKLVPQELRWAALAVGASRSQALVQVVLPAAAPAIVTGITLAIARAAGETAPLIFTALFSPFWPQGLGQPIATLAVLVYNFALLPFAPQQALAWAAALILVLLVLLTSLLARWVVRR